MRTAPWIAPTLFVTAAAALLAIVAGLSRQHRQDALPLTSSVSQPRHPESKSEATLSGPRSETAGQLRASFRSAQKCAAVASTLTYLKGRANCAFYDGKSESADAYAQCLDDAALTANSLAAAQDSMRACGGQEGSVRRYFEATRLAARAGDVDAQMCYVNGGFVTREGDFAFTPAERAEYQDLAPGYIEAALERGDWRVVRLLSTHVVDWAGPWVFLPQWQGPAREYQAVRLLRMGSEGPYAETLDILWSGRQVKASIATSGDAWARDMFERHFSSRPKLMAEPVVCGLEGS